MLAEKAKSYYLNNNYNCSEAILIAANELYDLGLSNDDIKLVSGFGTGMGCGNVCGALASIIAAFGRMTVDGKAHEQENFKELCAEIVKGFENELGSTSCETLAARYKKADERRCSEVVLMASEVAEKYFEKFANTKISDLDKCSLPPEEIKRVKGMGFLHCKGTDNFNARVITRNGKITAAEHKCIAEAAEKYGNGEVAMTTRLTLEVQSIPYKNIDEFCEFIEKEGLETGGTGSKVRPVVSCKGTTCQYGLLDTYSLAEKIHYTFYKGYREVLLPHKFKIAVGGCPNNCVKPDLNDVGVIGQRTPIIDENKCRGCNKCSIEQTCPIKIANVKEGKLEINPELCNNCGRCIGKCPFDAVNYGTYGYKITVGGRWGKKVGQGTPINHIFKTEDEVIDTIEKIILLYREQGITGERLSDTVSRIGFDKFERMILSNEAFERKNEILGGQKHTVGGATC